MELHELRVKHSSVGTKVFKLPIGGLELPDMYALLRAAFPQAGVIAGIEDDEGAMFPLAIVCKRPMLFNKQVYSLCVAIVQVPIVFTHGGETKTITVMEGSESAEVTGLLHALFGLPDTMEIRGLVDSTGAGVTMHNICKQPMQFAARVLTIVVSEQSGKSKAVSKGAAGAHRVKFADDKPAPLAQQHASRHAQGDAPPAHARSPGVTSTVDIPSLSTMLSMGKVDKDKRAVGVYTLRPETGEWVDSGKGFCFCVTARDNTTHLVVMDDSESGGTVLAEPIVNDEVDFAYEPPTVITFADRAVSFKSEAFCKEMFHQITRLRARAAAPHAAGANGNGAEAAPAGAGRSATPPDSAVVSPTPTPSEDQHRKLLQQQQPQSRRPREADAGANGITSSS